MSSDEKTGQGSDPEATGPPADDAKMETNVLSRAARLSDTCDADEDTAAEDTASPSGSAKACKAAADACDTMTVPHGRVA